MRSLVMLFALTVACGPADPQLGDGGGGSDPTSSTGGSGAGGSPEGGGPVGGSPQGGSPEGGAPQGGGGNGGNDGGGGDGGGGGTLCNAPGECPVPTNDCYEATCDDAVCGEAPRGEGASCEDGVCNATAQCVECLEHEDCSPTELCSSASTCAVPALVGGTIGNVGPREQSGPMLLVDESLTAGRACSADACVIGGLTP